MSEDLTDSLKENVKGPKRARGDSSEVEQHSIKDQIEADRYLCSKDATKNKARGFRLSKIVPSGSV